ncbi:hypothetical protein, partial [Nocardia farcinica]|uniref:hypothetical protein n=1 Tax=Nocardia farcinica TaxID=37329 RepID=UPI0024543170
MIDFADNCHPDARQFCCRPDLAYRTTSTLMPGDAAIGWSTRMITREPGVCAAVAAPRPIASPNRCRPSGEKDGGRVPSTG